MIKIILALSILFSTFASLSRAENSHPVPEVVPCLKAVDGFELGYRSRLQVQCQAVALELCVSAKESSEACLAGLANSYRSYAEGLLQRLPQSIEGTAVKANSYQRSLIRSRETLSSLADCSRLSGLEYQVCEVTVLGVMTTDLFYRARLANVSLP